MRYRIRSAVIAITAAMLLGSGPPLGLVLPPTASSGPALGSIAAGGYPGCAVSTDGTLACWGADSYSQSARPRRDVHAGRSRPLSLRGLS